MGLSNFPSSGDGLLPAVVVSTVFWVELLKGLLGSWLHGPASPVSMPPEAADGRWIARLPCAQFKTLLGLGGRGDWSDCSVCLSGFTEKAEVTELSCRHLFHRSCLQKWLGNSRRTCPLCRRLIV